MMNNHTSGFSTYVWTYLAPTDLKKKYGRWAIISGATDGIGLGFAKDLASRGHSLIIIGRNPEKLANVKSQLMEISKSPDEIVTIKIDLAQATEQDFARVAQEMKLDTKEVGILINNAGVFPSIIKRCLSHESKDLMDGIAVNVVSPVMLTKHVMPHMIKSGRGLVMNISSLLGEVSAPHFGIYGPTKHFVSEFSRTLQIEYADYPVDIVNFTTGVVYTKLITDYSSKYTEPSLVTPHPDDYARSALRVVSGSNSGTTSGYWVHGIQYLMASFFTRLGLWSTIFKLNVWLLSKDNRLSPTPGRKFKATKGAKESKPSINSP